MLRSQNKIAKSINKFSDKLSNDDGTGLVDKMDDKIKNWDGVKRVDQFEVQKTLEEFKEKNPNATEDEIKAEKKELRIVYQNLHQIVIQEIFLIVDYQELNSLVVEEKVQSVM